MRLLRRMLLALLAIFVMVRPGSGCSFDEDDYAPSHTDPDQPYAAFVAGKLGVVSGELRIRHMVVAYSQMSGRGLTPAEQKAAIDVDRFYNMGEGYYADVAPTQSADQEHTGPATPNNWYVNLPARMMNDGRNERSVPGSPYETFANCLDDAFAHAAATLAERRAKYEKPDGPDTPEISDWIDGQQAVFSNCSDQPPRPSYGPRSPQDQPAPVATMPQPVPANAPLWLKQDRAYQIAAAQFYALDYDHALTVFRAIAADKASPWARLSRYVVARVLIRKAVVAFAYDSGNPAQTELRIASTHNGLAEARDQLQAILRDPSMIEYHGPAQHLLDYVMVRLDPAGQTEELARRLAAPPRKDAIMQKGGALDRDYRQNVIDLTFAYNSLPLYSPVFRPKGSTPVQPKSPLLRWINDLYGERSLDMGETVNGLFNRSAVDHQQDSLAEWRSTHQPQWLAAALTNAEAGGDGVAEMSAAARAVPAASPAYATVTYHRLRLDADRDPKANYEELAALMPEIERMQPRSTINLFADLRSGVAPTVDLFLKTATRITSTSIEAEEGEGFPARPANPPYVRPAVTLCGVDIEAPDAAHLDSGTALIFNQRMPVRLLRDAALSTALPENVRFAVAHMAWTRALLLDDAATARALAPYLAQCQPAFKTWLDQYDAAKTPDERHVLGLLAMMRFTSTDPTVWPGRERDFAVYDGYRGNWWCGANQWPSGDPNAAKVPLLFSQPLVPRDGPRSVAFEAFSGRPLGAQPDPPFLTAADRAAADREVAALQNVPGASDYFATQALAWVKAHPDDARNPDVLGFAMRVVRNACRSDATKELNHQLFDTLHRRYPKSDWAAKYTTWE